MDVLKKLNVTADGYEKQKPAKPKPKAWDINKPAAQQSDDFYKKQTEGGVLDSLSKKIQKAFE